MSMLRKGDEPIRGYRLESRLGQGNYGIVWKATAPGRTAVALKFINLTARHGLKELRAVECVKNIRHAHLLPIHAVWLLDEEGDLLDELAAERFSDGGDDGRRDEYPPSRKPATLVVSMMLGDKNLFDRMKECRAKGKPGIPPGELLQYMEDSARGIDFLNSSRHDLGSGPIAIQHCDIKPQNIMLVGDSAMVCDFGVSRILGHDGTASAMPGSPAYIAPECIEGHKPSRHSDQYSLAISYAELRTGKLPLSCDSLGAVLNAHLRGKLDFSALPAAERQVIKKATTISPDGRFSSTMEMVRSLRKAAVAKTGAAHAGGSPLVTTLDDGGDGNSGGSVPPEVILVPEEPFQASATDSRRHDSTPGDSPFATRDTPGGNQSLVDSRRPGDEVYQAQVVPQQPYQYSPYSTSPPHSFYATAHPPIQTNPPSGWGKAVKFLLWGFGAALVVGLFLAMAFLILVLAMP